MTSRRDLLLALSSWAVAAPVLAAPTGARGPTVGESAPPLDLERIAGQGPVELGALRGRVVLIDFWTTWCGVCRTLAPQVAALAASHGGRGLSVLAVSDEPTSTIAAHLRRAPMPNILVARSPNGTRRYGVRAYPTFVVLDRGGRVQWLQPGDLAAARRRVEELLGEPRP